MILPRIQVPTLPAPFNPYALPGLAAAYDASDLNSIRADASNRVSFFADKSGNSGELAYVCTGTASQNLSATTKSVTGNQVFTLDVNMTNYTPGSNQRFFSKTSGNDGFELFLKTNGVVRIRIGNGSVITDIDAPAAVLLTNMTRHTISVIWQDGVGATFQKDGVNIGSQVLAAVTLTNSAVALTIDNASDSGIFYRMQIGTVYDCYPNRDAGGKGVTSWVSGGASAENYTLTTSGATGARIGGARDLFQGTGSAQPLLLPWSGANYAWNNGVASNTLSTPTLSITGNQTLVFSLQLDDYTPASNVTLLDKLSGNNGLQVLLLTTGVVRLRIGDGAAVTNVDSSIANSLTDGAAGTLGIVWTDGVGASFTQNGNALGTAVGAVKTLTNAAVSATIGPWSGRISLVTVGSVYRMDASQAAHNATSWASSTGETWTVNQSGAKPVQIVGRTSLLFDGSAYYLKTAAFTLNNPLTVVIVGKEISWTSAHYLLDGASATTSRVYQWGGTNALTNDAGGVGSVAWSLNTPAVVQAVFNGAASLIRINRGAAVTTSNANNAGGLTIAAVGDGSSPANIQVSRIFAFSTALDTATLDKIALWCGQRELINV